MWQIPPKTRNNKYNTSSMHVKCLAVDMYFLFCNFFSNKTPVLLHVLKE